MPDNKPKIKPLGNRVLIERSKPHPLKVEFSCPIQLKKNPKKGSLLPLDQAKLTTKVQWNR